jgi:hypothetical protein
MPHPRFWSYCINPGRRSTRWEVEEQDEAWAWRTRVRLREGRPMGPGEWPSPPPVFVYTSVKCFEDIPWPRRVSIFIVSDRLRALLEAEAPGAAEYLPVHLQGPRSRELPGPYWVMNWVRLLDCLDEEASMDEDEKGRFVQVPVIDPSRIPPDATLGLLKGYEVVKLIRDDLRIKIEKAGLTGLKYSPIAQLDSNPQTSIRPNRSARSKKAGRRR